MENKAVIYVRVSSEEQHREGFSIAAQIDLLKDYAVQNNFKVVRLFEEAQSAKQSGREKFNEMVQFLKKHKDVKDIQKKKTDRLYRNFKDYVTISETDYNIHLVKEHTVLTANSNSHEKMIHGVKVVMAKGFIDNLREETQKGRLKKVEMGYIIGQVPYGYKKLDPRTTIIDEETAPFVRRAFELFSKGDISLKKLSQQLYDEKYIYKSTIPIISASHLANILKNITYTGVIPYKDKFYEGKHEAIISTAMFEKAQCAFKKDNKPLYRKNHDFILGGLIRCAKCGAAITAEIKKDKYIYYHCTGAYKNCPQKGIWLREEELMKQVDKAVRAVSVNEKHIEYIKLGLKESLNDKNEYIEEKIARIQKDSEKQRKRIKNIFIKLLDEDGDTSVLEEIRKECQVKLEENNALLNAYMQADKKYYDTGVKLIDMLKNAYQAYSKQKSSEKRKMIKILLSNLKLEDGKLSYTYNLPFRYFVNFASCKEKYAWCDSNARPSA